MVRINRKLYKFVWVRVGMATKNISITVEAYNRLVRLKKEKDSFSEVINRELGKKDIMEFAGILSTEEADELENNIKKIRNVKEKYYGKRVERLKNLLK